MAEIEMGMAAKPLVDAETYGTVDSQVVALGQSGSAAAEQYRLLALKLEAYARAGAKRIAVTSAVRGEGRTLTAINVAFELGRARRNRVLLVDADMRTAALGGRLGLNSLTGLADVVQRQAPLGDSLWRFGKDDVWVLPAGATTEPHGVLGAPRLVGILEEAAREHDVVIVDAPPVLPTADVLELAPAVDAMVLVVRAGRTTREVVDMALDMLSGVRLLGIVLVGIEEEAGVTWRLLDEHDRMMRRVLPARSVEAIGR